MGVSDLTFWGKQETSLQSILKTNKTLFSILQNNKI